MNSKSASFASVWYLDFAPEYHWDKSGICFNTKTGKELKQAYKSRCIGYNIRGKFYSLNNLRTHLVKIKKD